jgi:DNA-binding transcriptional LysR family regulator
MSSFDLRQLRYFVTVAEEGQMVRAAHRLQLAQPALSQAIGRLESQLGVHLLERHARGVRLTAAGQAFLEKARAALAAADEVDATARSWARTQAGRLLIGFLSLTPPMLAGDLFEQFAEEHPDIRVEWRELGYPIPDAVKWLADVDAGLIWFRPSGAGVAWQPIRTSPLVAAMSKRHRLAGRDRLAVEDVLDETFPGITPECDPGWLAYWGLDRYRGSPATRTDDVAASPQVVASIVASGRAITTVPEVVAIPFDHLGIRAVPLTNAEPAVMGLVWAEEAESPLVGELVGFIRRLAQGSDPGLH